jgi:hypothetical protein
MNNSNDISKEQAIKDLEIENLSSDIQETVLGAFFRGLDAKIKLTLIDGMTEEQQKEFAGLQGNEQDDYIEKLVGGDMDSFVDNLYQEHLAEFNSATGSIAEGLK